MMIIVSYRESFYVVCLICITRLSRSSFPVFFQLVLVGDARIVPCVSVAGFHMSLDLYMSESSRVIGTFPMVFLKNTSSMVDGPTERSAGSSSSSFPKRHG